MGPTCVLVRLRLRCTPLYLRGQRSDRAARAPLTAAAAETAPTTSRRRRGSEDAVRAPTASATSPSAARAAQVRNRGGWSRESSAPTPRATSRAARERVNTREAAVEASGPSHRRAMDGQASAAAPRSTRPAPRLVLRSRACRARSGPFTSAVYPFSFRTFRTVRSDAQ